MRWLSGKYLAKLEILCIPHKNKCKSAVLSSVNKCRFDMKGNVLNRMGKYPFQKWWLHKLWPFATTNSVNNPCMDHCNRTHKITKDPGYKLCHRAKISQIKNRGPQLSRKGTPCFVMALVEIKGDQYFVHTDMPLYPLHILILIKRTHSLHSRAFYINMFLVMFYISILLYANKSTLVCPVKHKNTKWKWQTLHSSFLAYTLTFQLSFCKVLGIPIKDSFITSNMETPLNSKLYFRFDNKIR